jgi:hypothetical protein
MINLRRILRIILLKRARTYPVLIALAIFTSLKTLTMRYLTIPKRSSKRRIDPYFQVTK